MPANDLVLVTGATGFVAKHCIAELLKKGYRVRGTLRRPEAAAEVTAAVSSVVDPQGRLEFAELDLLSDVGWDAALRGCRFLMHVASPFPLQVPKNRDELIAPARGGTLRALGAAARAGVERAVLTSSTVAILSGVRPDGKLIFTEQDWSDPDSPSVYPYPLSKTLAERAAWDFVARDSSGMKLSAVCPSMVWGPTLDRDVGSSAELILLFLRGAYPGVPRFGISIVDVRDVAAMHVAVMEAPNAAGERFICASESLWLKDVARILRRHFPEFERNVPKRELPNLVVRLAAIFDATLRAIVPELGQARVASNEKAGAMLGFRFRTAEEATVAMARSLIDLGLVTPPKRK
jgi:dihydroflavonol-4-reductase